MFKTKMYRRGHDQWRQRIEWQHMHPHLLQVVPTPWSSLLRHRGKIRHGRWLHRLFRVQGRGVALAQSPTIIECFDDVALAQALRIKRHRCQFANSSYVACLVRSTCILVDMPLSVHISFGFVGNAGESGPVNVRESSRADICIDRFVGWYPVRMCPRCW